MLVSFPSSAFLAMHLMATSFRVAFSSARTTSEKAPLGGGGGMRGERGRGCRWPELPLPPCHDCYSDGQKVQLFIGEKRAGAVRWDGRTWALAGMERPASLGPPGAAAPSPYQAG